MNTLVTKIISNKTVIYPIAAAFFFVLAIALGSFIAVIFSSTIKYGSYLVAGGIGAVVFLLVGTPKKMLLFFLALSIPLNIAVTIYSRDGGGTISGIMVSVVDLCIFGLLLLLFLELFHNHNKKIIIPSSFWALLFLFLVTITSILVTTNKMYTLYGIVAYAKIPLLFLIVVNSCKRHEVITVFNFLLIGATVTALLYIIQSIFHINFNLTGQVAKMQASEIFAGNVRPAGTIGNAILSGGYFAGMLLLAIVSITKKQSIIMQMFICIAIIMLAWALVLTFARTAWLSFICGFFILTLVGAKRNLFNPTLISGILIFLIIGFFIFGDMITTRMTTSWSTQDSRGPLIAIAFNIIKHHPVLGVGINTYSQIIYSYIPAGFAGVWVYTAHNTYLCYWVELGIIGLMALLFILYMMFRESMKSLISKDHEFCVIGVGSISYFIATAVFMYNDHWDLFDPLGYTFCVLLALNSLINMPEKALESSSIKQIHPALYISTSHRDLSLVIPRESQ